MLNLFPGIDDNYKGPRIAEDGIDKDFMSTLVEFYKSGKDNRLNKRYGPFVCLPITYGNLHHVSATYEICLLQPYLMEANILSLQSLIVKPQVFEFCLHSSGCPREWSIDHVSF